MTSTTEPWSVRAARPEDRDEWTTLYRAYGAVAGQDLSVAHLDRVWSWIASPAAQTECVLLRRGRAAAPAGLAHYRSFERPLDGSHGCYLDDLFVAPTARGRGGARALLQHLASTAQARGWSTVRWTTGPDSPARSLFDRLAEESDVLTYNLRPGRLRPA
ncbi:GNAT family N-acetyltransferase [Nocardioides lianchengensis]|uniref:L-amino acid N-acyltransferase YncA n=1 Tax=Nocardioides lianchengensis TaxID=1045774 RepID=A0A1G6SG33_9ACTN|nr:GNAT family N-acetyltransferase [Nocardioides lianchengensis]NYG09809.1 GNAT superfamily N-acetyltransferase [Nocardioides lianchengensis]SDD15117.1 L-amino acid N-acyltransferase YncA [Nocardioides lianchengensis]